MDLSEKLIEVSWKLGTIQQFCDFVEDIHKMIGCETPDWNVEVFSATLVCSFRS